MKIRRITIDMENEATFLPNSLFVRSKNDIFFTKFKIQAIQANLRAFLLLT